MKERYMLISIFLTVLCCSCDAFLTYQLTVTDVRGKGIDKAEVTETGQGFTLSTDSADFIKLKKITGGIRPQRSKQVSLHKAGFADTVALLMPGSTTIKLKKQ